MDFNYSNKSLELQESLLKFFDEHIYPNEIDYDKAIEESGDPLHIPSVLEDLKEEAKKINLWNLFLPDENHGPGLSNLDYAPLAEIMGRVWWSSEVFNCSAPDTGNMEILAEFGTDLQKEEWLKPLLDGKIRSCFAMTEPNVASSDATNISSSIVSDGDNYVINGRKWWTSNAINPRAEICIFMGITNPDNPPHERQSQVLVPMNTEGVTIVRPMHVFGYDDGYTGHPEVKFENVIVPKTNLIGGEGAGFKIAQARLGPGRIHHCMRWIGMCERAFNLMCERAISRELEDGVYLSDKQTIQNWIAESRAEINAARLLVKETAMKIDSFGASNARAEISIIKFYCANVLQKVVDYAIQVHGALGVTDDIILSSFYRHERAARIYDGADEVHKTRLARLILKSFKK